MRERSLRNGAEAERLRRQHEVGDIGAAIDRAVDAERFVGVDDRNMRRAEEIEIFKRLLGVSRPVTARNAERVVELEAAFTPPLEVHAAIFPWKRKIAVVLAAACGCVDRLTKSFLGLAARDHDLPWLAVAPGRGALRGFQNVLDDRPRHRIRLEGAAGKALVQQFLENADALLGAVLAGES